MSKQSLRSRLAAVFTGFGVLVLVLVCWVVEATPARAVDAAPATLVSAATPVATWNTAGFASSAAWMDSVIGNQTRMIQAGLIVIAIGIFLLSRSIR